MAINREVLSTLGLVRGVTHTEFIRSAEDGRWYFLETSARVGGAYIVDVVAGRHRHQPLGASGRRSRLPAKTSPITCQTSRTAMPAWR